MSIAVHDLQKVYPGGKRALDGINLEIEGTFGLLGPNGAGKTTLMRILATLVEPTAGRVTLDGRPLKPSPELRRQIGYLPQKFGFYPQLTVYETMEFMAAISQIPANRTHFMELLDRVGLADRAALRVRQLSGGMVQRLGIATALINDPRLLIVDEPTAGLDHDARVGFRNTLAGLTSDRTVVLSTHIVADVEMTCSRLAVLNAGRVVFTGTPGQLAARAEGRVYLVTVDPADWRHFERRFDPVSAVRESEQIRARVVLDAPPPGYPATRVSPGLEDGYVWVLRRSEGGEAA